MFRLVKLKYIDERKNRQIYMFSNGEAMSFSDEIRMNLILEALKWAGMQYLWKADMRMNFAYL